MRNAFAQLARAEEDVAKLMLAHESAQAEWKCSKKFLELNEAITRWVILKTSEEPFILWMLYRSSPPPVILMQESLSEQAQILQGKISVLEDELQRAQSQEKVLGSSIEVSRDDQEWCLKNKMKESIINEIMQYKIGNLFLNGQIDRHI